MLESNTIILKGACFYSDSVRTFSERTWSAKVLYETSVTNASGAIPNNDVNTVRDLTRPTTHKRRHPITSSASRQQDQSRASRTHMYSDSGLGTTALDYAQSGK